MAEPWSGYWTASGINDATARTAIETFHAGLATDGIQSKIKVFVILAGEAATATNVMQNAYHGSLVNSPTFTQWLGVRSDAATSYVSAVVSPASISGVSTDSMLIGAFASQDEPANGVAYLANYLVGESYNGPNGYEAAALTPAFNGSADEMQFNVAVNDQFGAVDPYAAWSTLADVRIYASRTGATTLKSYRNAAETGDFSDASETRPTAALFMGAYNADGSPSWSGDDDTFDGAGYVIAEGLDGTEQALLDGRAATLFAALRGLGGGAVTYTRTANLNAAIQKAQIVTGSINAVVQKTQTTTASVDAAIRAALTQNVSLDAYITIADAVAEAIATFGGNGGKAKRGDFTDWWVEWSKTRKMRRDKKLAAEVEQYREQINPRTLSALDAEEVERVARLEAELRAIEYGRREIATKQAIDTLMKQIAIVREMLWQAELDADDEDVLLLLT